MVINPGDGGYSVDEALLQYIFDTLPVGKTILELGAGESTKRFKEHGYNVISVEHDVNWINIVPGVTYIHAPIELYEGKYDLPPSLKKRVDSVHTGWYNRKALAEGLLGRHYDLVLVDGPPRNYGRTGFIHHINLFKLSDIPIIFDDMHRRDEMVLARRVAAELKRDLLIKNNGYEIIGHKPNGDPKHTEQKPFGVIL